MQASTQTHALATILSQHKSPNVKNDQAIWMPQLSESRARPGEPTVVMLSAMFKMMEISSESRSMGTVKTRADVNRALDQCPMSTHKVAVSMVLLDFVQRMNAEDLLALTDSLQARNAQAPRPVKAAQYRFAIPQPGPCVASVTATPVKSKPVPQPKSVFSVFHDDAPGAQDSFSTSRYSPRAAPVVQREDEEETVPGEYWQRPEDAKDAKQREVKVQDPVGEEEEEDADWVVCLCGAHTRQARSAPNSLILQSSDEHAASGTKCMAKTKDGYPCKSTIAVGEVTVRL